MTDAEILNLVDAAFADATRPASFTGATVGSLPEVIEHERTLESRNRGTLTIADLGQPGWSPLTFLTPEGFRYYMPTLIRLALSDGGGELLDYMVYTLSEAIDLKTPPRSLPQTSLFDRPQVEATLRFLEHVRDTRPLTLQVWPRVVPRGIRNWRYFLDCFEEASNRKSTDVC